MRNDDPLKALIVAWFVFFLMLGLSLALISFTRSEIDNLQQQIDILEAQLLIRAG